MRRPLSLRIWILALAAFACTVYFTEAETVLALSKDSFLVPPPEHIEYFHFGFRESMADSFWLRWIQDGLSCQTYLQAEKKLEQVADLQKDSLISNIRHRVCDNSWSFKMLDTVTRLAPKFEMPYLAGGSALAVVVEDYAGASVIFDRGIEQFPDDWRMCYRGAYHFLYDDKNLAKAAKLLERAGDIGAPPWVKSLAARIYTETGQLELGISALESYRKTVTNEKALPEIDARIAELKAKMAKEP